MVMGASHLRIGDVGKAHILNSLSRSSSPALVPGPSSLVSLMCAVFLKLF